MLFSPELVNNATCWVEGRGFARTFMLPRACQSSACSRLSRRRKGHVSHEPYTPCNFSAICAPYATAQSHLSASHIHGSPAWTAACERWWHSEGVSLRESIHSPGACYGFEQMKTARTGATVCTIPNPRPRVAVVRSGQTPRATQHVGRCLELNHAPKSTCFIWGGLSEPENPSILWGAKPWPLRRSITSWQRSRRPPKQSTESCWC